MWYVYILIDPRNNQPFYVGKGTAARLKNTKVINKKGNNQLKNMFLAEIKSQGLRVEQQVIAEYLDETQALDHEKKLIEQYGRIIKGTGILTNFSDGGDTSNTGWTPTKETKDLWSSQRRGRKQSPEHVALRANAIRGRSNTEDQNNNIRIAKIKSNAEQNLKIIDRLENTTYYHGLYKKIANELGCDQNLITRISKNINFYKDALREWH